jgi:hypothetical protein
VQGADLHGVTDGPWTFGFEVPPFDGFPVQDRRSAPARPLVPSPCGHGRRIVPSCSSPSSSSAFRASPARFLSLRSAGNAAVHAGAVNSPRLGWVLHDSGDLTARASMPSADLRPSSDACSSHSGARVHRAPLSVIDASTTRDGTSGSRSWTADAWSTRPHHFWRPSVFLLPRNHPGLAAEPDRVAAFSTAATRSSSFRRCSSLRTSGTMTSANAATGRPSAVLSFENTRDALLEHRRPRTARSDKLHLTEGVRRRISDQHRQYGSSCHLAAR